MTRYNVSSATENHVTDFIPTDAQRKQVEAMSGFGSEYADIAALLGITVPVLRKVFKAEIAMGIVKANLKVSQGLFQKATKGDAGAAAALEARRTRPPTKGTRKGNGAGYGASPWGGANGAGAPSRPAFEIGNLLGKGGDPTEKSKAREAMAAYMLEIQLAIAENGDNDNARLRATEVIQERMIGKVAQINKNENTGPDGGPLEIAVIKRVIVDPRNTDT